MFWRTEGKQASKVDKTAGQSTVEAAFLIPLLLVCIIIAVQPGILLFNRVIMIQAAWDACQLAHVSQESDNQEISFLTLRHLQAIPDAPAFHAQTWEVTVQGDEESSDVRVEISHGVQLLPGVAQIASGLGLAPWGIYEQRVEVSWSGYEEWAAQSPLGLDPQAWVGRWEEQI